MSPAAPEVNCLHDAGAAAVIEHQAVGVLNQAGSLLFSGLVETLLIDFDVEAARQQLGLPFHRLGVAGIVGLHRRQVRIQPGTIQASLVQILGARTKAPGRPRTALRKVLKSPPVSGARNTRACSAPSGNGYVQSLLTDFLIPGLGFGKPIFGRRIHRTA